MILFQVKTSKNNFPHTLRDIREINYELQVSLGLQLVAGRVPGGDAALGIGRTTDGRGYAGPNSLHHEEQYWPFECTSSRQCWSSAVAKHDGWENYDVKFLACDIQSGFCKCKQGYMDADDDRYNGCETKVRQIPMCNLL